MRICQIAFYTISFVLSCLFSYSQDTIPFVLNEQNNIVIQAILNKHDTVKLMFHTAVNDVSLTEEKALQIADMQSSQSVTAQSWGGENEAKYLTNNHLQILDFKWDSINIWVSQLSGRGTDGKFGPSLFKDQIIEIDYDKNILIVIPDIDFRKDLASFTRKPIAYDRGTMYIDAELNVGGEWIEQKLMIHTGYNGTVLLDDQFSAKHVLREKLDIINESILRDSYGNVLKTSKAIIQGLSIGGWHMTDVPIGFFEGKIGNQKSSVVGCEILKRFNIIIDQKNEWIYFSPNTNRDKDFESVKKP